MTIIFGYHTQILLRTLFIGLIHFNYTYSMFVPVNVFDIISKKLTPAVLSFFIIYVPRGIVNWTFLRMNENWIHKNSSISKDGFCYLKFLYMLHQFNFTNLTLMIHVKGECKNYKKMTTAGATNSSMVIYGDRCNIFPDNIGVPK